MIWAAAEGCRVVDADGREYIDLTAGFGVAALGHRNPLIAEAWAAQPVVHALGDLAEAEVTQRLRIYVPFGRHWYAYSVRRLQENPSIAGYIAADTVGRMLGRRNHDALA